MAESDYELVKGSLAMPDMFAVIFDRHARLVYRYVRRRVGDELAADVTAEVFAQAFHHRVASTDGVSRPCRGFSGSRPT